MNKSLMINCGICGKQIEIDKEELPCNHIPDIYLDVWNCQHRLMRSRYYLNNTKTEILPFNVPENWVEWILDTCGGSINRSGIYRLPGMVWEWAIAKMRDDENMAAFLEKQINEYLEDYGRMD